MKRFMKLLATDEGMVTYGEEEVRRKLEIGAVGTLLFSEELDAEFIHDLVEKAEGIGADVEVISTEFEEGAQLMRAFGGVAALLRYRSVQENKILTEINVD